MEKEHIFDITMLQQQFGSVNEAHDPLAGNGVEAIVERDAGDTVAVQFFPDTGIAKVDTRRLHVLLRGAQVAIDEENDALELRSSGDEEWVLVTVYRTGSVQVNGLPAKPRDQEHASEPPPAPSKQTTVGHEGASSPPTEQETNPRVTLTGRVGQEPRFRTTNSGTLVGSFPLAVHEEDGKTAWHTVVAFKERAEQLQTAIGKGQEVDVVGYVHASEYKDKDGNSKERKEVWASVVKPSKPKE
jgi:Single-strand binding protein family